MKVVLLQNIKGFGRIGDIKNVSDGHARNFLLPRKLAKIADETTEQQLQQTLKHKQAREEKTVVEANLALKKLSEISIAISKKSSPNGTLFSSVTKEEVARELSKKSGFNITGHMIDFGESGEHIKHTGDHVVTVILGANLHTTTKISIN